jgi:8-amino-7-oxononanoate synthase
MKLAGVNGIRFRHNDASHLESRLRQHESEQKLIIIEGVYSMDGDIAPLPEIVSLAKRYHAYLAVDEAHSFGTLGKTGLGVAQHFSLKEDDIDFKIGTLGKAVGSEGGYIAAKQCFVDLLRYSANSYIFTTSCVTPSVAGALAALSLIEHTHSHVEKLHQNSKYTRNKLVSMGFDIAESQTHIIPVIIPDDDAVISVQRELEQQGILMSLVTFPAVPLGKSRLRINITAAHTRKQINDMLEKLYQVALNHGIIT